MGVKWTHRFHPPFPTAHMARKRDPGTSRRPNPARVPGGRTALPPPPPNDTGSRLEAWRRCHHEWLGRFPSADPIYPIPEQVIGCVPLNSYFDPDAEAAELELAGICREARISGVWRPWPVCYDLLLPPPPLPPLSTLQSVYPGWTARDHANLSAATGRAATARDRLLGVAGWLMTEPAFRSELADVRADYDALPEGYRPVFPLGRVLQLNSRMLSRTAHPDLTPVEPFRERLTQFLDRWGVCWLATWDLPTPQGSWMPHASAPDSVVRPTHGVQVIVPVHYPLQGDDDLLRLIREQQRQQAGDLGLPAGLAGIRHHEQYAQMFRLLHLEHAVFSRFPDARPSGLVSAFEAAAAEHLGLSAESVRRMRRWIAACRAGRRDSIRHLAD